MLRRFLERGEGEPTARVITNEQVNVHDAIRLATETSKPQLVKIDGEKHQIVSDGYGTEIKPLKSTG